ncbi:ABC transporter substrate-binding protein [Labrenzia sp. VG12]|uniref:substrate-binding periplasmic protein n=1 Tax=Labrenzia sp. VG12 TaxID=2021862 RepID=UPI0012FDB519|nr:transporter substrate-binding domain-containing protein [Labrenzia sp. VG12]
MRLLLATFSIIALIGQAFASDLLIVTEELPPYNYEEDGVARGMSTEVVQAVLAETGLEADIVFYPWARSYLMAQTRKNTLIYSMARIPEREDLFEWVGIVCPITTSFFKLASNDKIQINSLDDARAYLIGVTLKNVNHIYLEGKGFTKFELESQDLINMRKLAHGRIDLVPFDEASFYYQVRRDGMDPELFEPVYRLDDLSKFLYMAFSKNSDPDLVEKFKLALTTIQENGVYDGIVARYQLMN